MKIIVDAFGGDNAPLEILKGCQQAVEEYGLEILLTGSQREIQRVAKENAISLEHMEIVDAPDIITMEDPAGEIMKSKSNCSMAVSYTHLDVYKRQFQYCFLFCVSLTILYRISRFFRYS